MPNSVRIKTLLHGVDAKWQSRSPHPRLHILEDSLDLGVELPCPDLAADVGDTHRLNTLMKVRPELASMVGDFLALRLGSIGVLMSALGKDLQAAAIDGATIISMLPIIHSRR